MAVVIAAVALFTIFAPSDPLQVVYENSLLKIQNVGDKPITIKDILINDRKDCKFINAAPHGNVLKIGDSYLLFSLCDAVRVTITTTEGSETYEISR